MPRSIHVALTFNDKYWALAYTVMRSICLTTTRRRDVVFHLCHTPLTPEHAAIHDRIVTEFGATLRHYDPTENADFRALVAQLPANDRFPPIVYTRLVLDKLLPAEVDRVIYLDCDVMVVQPIEMLFEQEMGKQPIAAVFDPYHLGVKKGRDIRQRQTPFDTGDPYFNSGVMLIDVERYRAADLPVRLAEFAASGVLKNLFFDQDMLNLVFLNAWQPLNWRFNVLNPKPAHESLQPVIVHYTSGSAPWKLVSLAAFSRFYRHVMTQDVYYRYMAERSPGWLRPVIARMRAHSLSGGDIK